MMILKAALGIHSRELLLIFCIIKNKLVPKEYGGSLSLSNALNEVIGRDELTRLTCSILLPIRCRRGTTRLIVKHRCIFGFLDGARRGHRLIHLYCCTLSIGSFGQGRQVNSTRRYELRSLVRRRSRREVLATLCRALIVFCVHMNIRD